MRKSALGTKRVIKKARILFMDEVLDRRQREHKEHIVKIRAAEKRGLDKVAPSPELIEAMSKAIQRNLEKTRDDIFDVDYKIPAINALSYADALRVLQRASIERSVSHNIRSLITGRMPQEIPLKDRPSTYSVGVDMSRGQSDLVRFSPFKDNSKV